MKIAFLTPEYPHPKTGNSGGIGTSIKNLAESLVKMDFEVSVLVFRQKEDEVFYDKGITFYRIYDRKTKGFGGYYQRKKVYNLINNLYKAKKIDIIESPDWTGSTSLIRTQCPIVIRLNGSDTYFCHLENRPVKWINKFHEKRALQIANSIISVSSFTADLTKTIFGIKKEIEVIPNSINLSNFEKCNFQPESDIKTILYFGTLIRKKGLLELPYIFNEVIKINPNIKLILIGKDASDIKTGSNSTWKLMEEKFNKQSLQNVEYLGSVPYEEIKNKIQESTVCVFPSFAEALPVSWIEAMAMQKPIVASNIGWANEVIDDGINGFLVHPKEHLLFAQKIIKLIENEELSISFGKLARIKVEEKFDAEKVVLKNIDFYSKIIKSKRG
jgi:glycosyltransferase involved in cell wall biosynthesis